MFIMEEQKSQKSDIAKMEEAVLLWWEKHRVFEKVLARRKGKKHFVFYEGPPTANGSPHPGHVMGRCFKDLFLRYKTMQGYFAPRRAGWDTHGLPVEIEVEKQLGFRSKADIEKLGVAEFNRLCRESVWKYRDEWERMSRRVGFWLDMEHPYVTYENAYMQTLWWIIARIFKKGLLKEDYKVVPFCTRCGTGLSSHEIAQGYKTVKENSVYVKFKLQKRVDPDALFEKKSEGGAVFDDRVAADAAEYFLVWTTTPWTLPANVALAVHPDLEYVRARKGDEVVVLAKDRASSVLGEGWKVLETLKGSALVGVAYEQLFLYCKPDAPAFFIVAEPFVSAVEGTGIVHIAPAYGEDDMAAAKRHKLPVLHPVKENGEFSAELPWQDMFVKKADELIVKELAGRGVLYKEEAYEHEYPFCWRCDTPLLYFARKSWFVHMTSLRARLLSLNATINWVPLHLKEGRFGGWLSEVKDWAFSRDRFWGTPLPIWRCQTCARTEATESIAELASRSRLKNRYFVMRHGEAAFNKKNIVDSSGTHPENVLTEKGKDDVRASVRKFSAAHPEVRFDLVVTSPFLRTKETAEIVADVCGISASAVEQDVSMREINTGVFDGKKPTAYHRYFASLEEKFTKRPPEGEILVELRARMVAAIRRLEIAYQGKTVLIVSHEYPLWMLETGLLGFSSAEAVVAKKEKGADFIKTAEIRELPSGRLPLDGAGNLDLHKPYVDEITFLCGSCGGTMQRVPEVADVWFDSGAMPFAQAHFPFACAQFRNAKCEMRNLVNQISYPADFICEGVDQTRGWFYTLLAVAALLDLEAPYRNVVSLGHILDKHGKKMSKKNKNYADPMELADRFGIDALRWYFFTVNPAGEPKRFDEHDLADAQRKSVMVLLNIRNFIRSYALRGADHVRLPSRMTHILDRWVVSRLHSTTAVVHEAMERYDAFDASRNIAAFLDDLTNWYIRRSRERFQLKENERDFKAVSAVLAYVFVHTTRLLAPFLPFVCEQVWRDIYKNESVHAEDYPRAEARRIDKQLEYDMIRARETVTIILKKRSEAGIKVRQPLSLVKLKKELPAELAAIMASEVNVKKVVSDPALEEEIWLDVALTPELQEEGMIREIVRNVQAARKDAGLTQKQQIALRFAADDRLANLVEKWREYLTARVGARRIEWVSEEKLDQPKEIAFDGARVLFVIQKLK